MCSPFPPDDYEGSVGCCRICGTWMYTPKGGKPKNPCVHVKEALEEE